ncbi:MAG: hypothetical protein ABI605_13180 [Rhizobacter sp.]
MPAFRADFEVWTDLVIPEGVANLEIDTGGFSLHVSNAARGEDGHVHHLVAKVIGEAPSLEEAGTIMRSVLAERLDAMCFATHSRFEITRCLQVIDWTPNLEMRELYAIGTIDPRLPPSPELGAELHETINWIAQAEMPNAARAALRSFRYACIARQVDAQFSGFWSAMEVSLEYLKTKQRVPVICGNCKANMVCAACGKPSMRTPMAKQAIDEHIQKEIGGDWAAASRELFVVRNGLAHGRRSSSIEAELGQPIARYVEMVATMSWNSIMEVIGPLLDGKNWNPVFATHGSFVVGRLEQKARLQIGKSAGEVPTEDELPRVEITAHDYFRDEAS